ncbi:MAG: hypothetical protein ACKOPS_17265 [Cyanobium sp.]
MPLESVLLGWMKPGVWQRVLPRGSAAACRAVVAFGLVALISLGGVAPGFAAATAPQGSAGQPEAPVERRADGEPRATGPRNPYDMKALQQFDAGSHRAEEPS